MGSGSACLEPARSRTRLGRPGGRKREGGGKGGEQRRTAGAWRTVPPRCATGRHGHTGPLRRCPTNDHDHEYSAWTRWAFETAVARGVSLRPTAIASPPIPPPKMSAHRRGVRCPYRGGRDGDLASLTRLPPYPPPCSTPPHPRQTTPTGGASEAHNTPPASPLPPFPLSHLTLA